MFKTFDDNKLYIFNKDIYNKNTNGASLKLAEKLHNMLVTVESNHIGTINILGEEYMVLPEWCSEINTNISVLSDEEENIYDTKYYDRLFDKISKDDLFYKNERYMFDMDLFSEEDEIDYEALNSNWADDIDGKEVTVIKDGSIEAICNNFAVDFAWCRKILTEFDSDKNYKFNKKLQVLEMGCTHWWSNHADGNCVTLKEINNKIVGHITYAGLDFEVLPEWCVEDIPCTNTQKGDS